MLRHLHASLFVEFGAVDVLVQQGKRFRTGWVLVAPSPLRFASLNAWSLA